MGVIDYMAMTDETRTELMRRHARAVVALKARMVWFDHAVQTATQAGVFVGAPYGFTGDPIASCEALEALEKLLADGVELVLGASAGRS